MASPAASAPVQVQVRCAGCRAALAVAPSMTAFVCPKCRMAQRLPPELMPPSGPTPPPPPQTQPVPRPRARRSAPRARGVDPTKLQLPCARCKAVLNVPHGLERFRCPQCGVDNAVDLSKLRHFFASAGPAFTPTPAATSANASPALPADDPRLPVLPVFPHPEQPEEITEMVRLHIS